MGPPSFLRQKYTMTVSKRNSIESIPNKETAQQRFQPSKKRIRLTNLPTHSHAEFNFQILVTLVIVCVMCLAGTIQPPVTHRRRLPEYIKKLESDLESDGFYKLGKFKTRNVKNTRSGYSHNKNRYYFYKKIDFATPERNDYIGVLLLCKRTNGRKWNGRKKNEDECLYTETHRLIIYKNREDKKAVTGDHDRWTNVTLKEHGMRNTTKWVRIKTRDVIRGHTKVIEIRDGSGWD